MSLNIKCPECGAIGQVAKNGKKWSGRHRLQMYRCSKCGKVFSELRITENLVQAKPETTATPEMPVVETKPVAKEVEKKPVAKKEKPQTVKTIGVCPACGGALMKAGMDKDNPEKPVQRYICKACHKRTISPKAVEKDEKLPD